MRKVTLLFAMAAMLLCGKSFAQFSYNFDQYNAGDKIAQTIGDPWTTWSNAPGGAEDGVFSNDIAASGSISAKLAYGNDQVLEFGNKETGVYNIEFDVLVPEGYNGYFNVLHNFAGANSTWALQCYLHETNDGQNSTSAPGQGTLHAGGNAVATLTCVYDEWMHVKIHVDTDNDVAEFYFNGTLIHTWQWSLDSFGENTVGRTLSAMNFFPPENAATSLFYVDNVVFEQEGADQELIGDSFEEYTVGNKVAQEAAAAGNDWWTTWNNNPGSAEDAVVSDAFASEGTQSMYIGSTSNDMVLLFGEKETGVYDIQFDMYFEQGKNGYFNILHDFAGSNSTWAMQAYFHLDNDGQNTTSAPGYGMIHAGSNHSAEFTCVYDQWMTIKLHIDTDNDVAEFYVNDELIHTWQWSLDSFGENTVGRTLDAADFFAPLDGNSTFYVDNIHFNQIGSESAPDMSVSATSFSFELPADDMTSQAFTIANDGNSIGDWIGWVDFGEGAGGSTSNTINYDAENSGQGVGFTSGTPLVEVGARFPAAAYAGAVMGTNITKAKYFVIADQTTGQAAFSDGLTFRIYQQGLNGNPGAVLAEKVLPQSSIVAGQWNEVTFDTPIALTGYDVWATVEYTQNEGGFPIAMDGLAVIPDGDYYRINSGSWSHLNEGASEVYGNHNIRITCVGTPVIGSWASLDASSGSLLGGHSQDVNMSVNSIGLVNDIYEANLKVLTNDANNPEIIVPITLEVGGDGTVELNIGGSKIYPNPATSQVVLEGENLNSVAIYNAVGQLINVVKLNSAYNTIDMSDIEAGVYFFNIKDNNGMNTIQRVVVAK
jgi:hypothetical protein